MNPLSSDLLDHLVRRQPNKRRYLDITDHINTYPYRLMDIPDIAGLRSAYELDPFTGGPVKTPFGYEVGAGRYSINWMINSYASQIPFTFVDYKDCISAAEYLAEYIDALKDRGHLDEDETTYLLRAEEFNVTLQKIARKLIAYYKVNLPRTSIFKLQRANNLKKILASEAVLHEKINNLTSGKKTNKSGQFKFLGGNPNVKD